MNSIRRMIDKDSLPSTVVSLSKKYQKVLVTRRGDQEFEVRAWNRVKPKTLLSLFD